MVEAPEEDPFPPYSRQLAEADNLWCFDFGDDRAVELNSGSYQNIAPEMRIRVGKQTGVVHPADHTTTPTVRSGLAQGKAQSRYRRRSIEPGILGVEWRPSAREAHNGIATRCAAPQEPCDHGHDRGPPLPASGVRQRKDYVQGAAVHDSLRPTGRWHVRRRDCGSS